MASAAAVGLPGQDPTASARTGRSATTTSYHDEVDAFIGVAGVGGDTAYPEGLDYPQPPHPMGKPGIKSAEAANKLGWHWWPGTNAIPSQKHKA